MDFGFEMFTATADGTHKGRFHLRYTTTYSTG